MGFKQKASSCQWLRGYARKKESQDYITLDVPQKSHFSAKIFSLAFQVPNCAEQLPSRITCSQHQLRYRCVNICKYESGWWFGTFYIFPYIGNFIIPIDFPIFQRGRYTTNQ